jgi:2',3'-cyclic-nucleotide 2'-phosphodiesterase (5'-nucleotidase family)
LQKKSLQKKVEIYVAKVKKKYEICSPFQKPKIQETMNTISRIKYRNLFLVILVFTIGCSTPYHYDSSKTTGKITILDSVNIPKPDSLVHAIILPYKMQLDSQMNKVIAYSEKALQKDLPEGLLNNLVADLSLIIGNQYLTRENNPTASVCLLNQGGLRSTLPKGAITVGNVFELMPFDNEFVVLEINGKKMEELCNFLAAKGGMPVSGLSLTIKDDKANNILIQGKPLDISKNYFVITSDYLSAGNDEMTFFLNPISTKNISLKVRDAIIEYFNQQTKLGNTLNPVLDKRISYEK